MSTNKDQLRQRIIECSYELFVVQGIKPVTMDDVAHNVGISKRTLYEIFQNKESLVAEALLYHHNVSIAEIESIKSRNLNVLETFLSIFKYSLDKYKVFSTQFLQDLERYPSAKGILLQGQSFEVDEYKNFFLEGVAQGIFLPDVNYDIMSVLIKQRGEFLSHNKNIFSNFSFDEVAKTLILSFLRGIATDRGLVVLEEFRKNLYGM